MKKIFISVGEVSGDNYASQLIRLLPDFEWVGITGTKMREAGCKTVGRIEDLAVVGITEAIPKYLKIKRTFRKALEELDKGVDLLVVVDFPGFNLKLLKEAKKRGIKTIYFIAPQVWAWGKGRIPKIVKNTDILISIWPFEKDIYQPYLSDNFRLEFVGHPLLDIVKTELSKEEFKEKLNIPVEKEIFGFLPGSRESEVKTLLPIMLQSAEIILEQKKNLHFVIPITPNVEKLARQIISGFKDLPVSMITSRHMQNPSYEVMNNAVFSVIASGTATLEAAIIGNPFLLVYKVSPFTFFIGKLLVDIDFLGLPNIIAGKEVIKELLQKECNPQTIAEWSLKYLQDNKLYEKTRKELELIRKKLGEKGALYKTADIIRQFISAEENNTAAR